MRNHGRPRSPAIRGRTLGRRFGHGGRVALDGAGGRRPPHSRPSGRSGEKAMTDTDILVWLAALLCVALSFLFSGMETGVLALNRFRIRQRMRTGDRRAAVLHGFLENPENFL